MLVARSYNAHHARHAYMAATSARLHARTLACPHAHTQEYTFPIPEGVEPLSFSSTKVKGVSEGREYRFSVIAENEWGKSDPSEMSNPCRGGKQLPEGWVEHKNDKGVPFYYHKASKTTRWDWPTKKAYHVPARIEAKFSKDELEDFQDIFERFDEDDSGAVSMGELRRVLTQIGVSFVSGAREKVQAPDRQCKLTETSFARPRWCPPLPPHSTALAKRRRITSASL